MEYAKKMILVPSETVERLQQTPVSSDPLHELHRELSRILAAHDLNDSDKWAKYQQVLERSLRFAEQRQKPLKLMIDAPEDQSSLESLQPDEKPQTQTLAPEREDRGESSSDDILNTLPKTFRNKGSVLLKRLQKNDTIKWGRDGKVKIEGKAIEGSNIADLVNDAMRNRKNSRIPTGHREFYSVLAKMNVPQELIGNPER
ncbi:unnamed protein product [Bemisia tabaci]|uniref:Uncharacterized protein n=1 Tax=Bemisia tabaci TaxID=7038 RepID=A0A9P0EZK5_BEMTA|nr:unnamed protein product [Bemisia tabaci]